MTRNEYNSIQNNVTNKIKMFKKKYYENFIQQNKNRFKYFYALNYGIQQFQNQYLLVQLGLCSYGLQLFHNFVFIFNLTLFFIRILLSLCIMLNLKLV